jgi:hypothetical protein
MLYGCTVTGFMIGKTADDSAPEYIVVSQEGILGLKTNREINVIRWQGDTLTGTYLGLQQDSLDLYQQNLLAFR